MENMGRVDFYEIWDGECLLCEVGLMGEDTQAQANALAEKLALTAAAHYNRTGDVFA